MLNFIYYPISWVLWFWHKAWGLILDPDSGITWALSIIFLVVTLRLLLLRPMIKQLRSGRKMQEMQPRMQEIKRKYAKDQQQQALEMRKLQKEMGVNPLASCLPMLVQIPIFIGLFHVLRSFNRTGTGTGQLGMSIEETRNTANYGFGIDEVQSFLDARLFGAPLSSYISMPTDSFGAFTDDGSVDFTRANIAFVVIPMMLVAAVIMHFNAKHSLVRQARRKAEQAKSKKKGATTPQQDMMENQMAMMQKLMVWVMPVLSLVGAYFWHVGLAVYMLTNTSWTFVQQVLVYRKMDREEAEEKEAKLAAKRTNAPKPGKKPKDHGQAQATSTVVLEHTEDEKGAKDAKSATPANPFTGAESQESPAGPPLSEEQVETYRSEAAAMSPEKLDATIDEIETQLKDPATKKRAKKQKRLAVLRQFRDEQR
ncbi:membrane protein insertase YidC [Corynebacterium variabile]|uniref:Membrane protein insertase YidC n=2 Tax=Corynebacterium variabile TaxID=1727 RepID=A0A0X2NJW2_9CORY|nr:membrane protein insertase YidC [Corynebacterium variabile]AEK38382.1 inner membrane protein translocase component [Corynebacterium variabile DSM 44702]CUU65785.1 membrane protein insertase, YidC/Oxa1 family, C-terminal domain [Corynebacterium variabile]